VTAKIVKGLTEAQKREFIVKDNAAFGEWNFDDLANNWSDLPLADFGVDLPADWLPRNGESRAIAYAFRFIKKTYPWIKWVISFADGTQCGDGTIYRASGFVLTGFSSGSMWELPPDLAKIDGGPVAHRLKVQDKSSALSREVQRRTLGKNCTMEEYARRFGGHIIPGFQLRYIYFLDPTAKGRLTVPILPFSEIERRGAGMYKGIKRVTKATSDDQLGGGGAIPTHALQNTAYEVNPCPAT